MYQKVSYQDIHLNLKRNILDYLEVFLKVQQQELVLLLQLLLQYLLVVLLVLLLLVLLQLLLLVLVLLGCQCCCRCWQCYSWSQLLPLQLLLVLLLLLYCCRCSCCYYWSIARCQLLLVLLLLLLLQELFKKYDTVLGRIFAKKKLEGRNTKCPSGYKIVETDESRKLTQDFLERIIIKDHTKVKVQGILCPDYEVNQAYYNSVFTGNKHKIGLTITQCTNGLMGHSSNYFTNDYRHFYVPSYYDMGIRNSYDFKIVGVPDDVTLTGIDDMKFRSRAGTAEEAWRYECVGDDYKSDYSK